MKRFTLYFLAALLLMGCAARRSAAQFIGFTSPQTVVATPFPPSSTCVGDPNTPQTANVQNLGQNEHQTVFLAVDSGITATTVQLQGSNDGVNFFHISDPAVGPVSNALSAQGYYTLVRVAVFCAPAGKHFSVQYSGTSGTPGSPQGAIKSTYLDKGVFNRASSGTTVSSPSQVTPFGNSNGLLYFQYVTGGLGGSTITITCGSTNIAGITYTFSPANTINAQTFTVPANPCTFYSVTYTAGGASANTFVLDYVFAEPGSQISSGSIGSNVNLVQVGGATLTLGQLAMASSLPVAIASDQSAIPVSIGGPLGQQVMAASLPVTIASNQTPLSVAEPAIDPCQSPAIAKASAFANITTATTTSLVPVSGSTVVYVCAFDLDISSTTTASTVLLEQGTGAACASSPTALTPTYTNGGAGNSFKSATGGGSTLFKTSASNGLCAVSTVGSTPTTGVRVTYVQQ